MSSSRGGPGGFSNQRPYDSGRSGSPSVDSYNSSGSNNAPSRGMSSTQPLPRTQQQPATSHVQSSQRPAPSPMSGQGAMMMRERQSQGVEQVVLSADVFFVCMTHALTTEKDEICGLLLGQPSEDGRRIDITACFPLPRGTHRQKDRVEITPLQMAMGVEHADALQKSHQMSVRVVGWYHSHPRLMPIPSSVDVRSQEACEQQDPTFVGLIFTPFNAASKQTPLTQQLQLLAFKTDRSSSLGFRQLPISVVDGGRGKSGLGGLSRWALDTLADLLTVLQSEEDELMSQVSTSGSNFIANTAYSYRLMRVMNEIGYPLIAALESRLHSSRNEASVSGYEGDSVQGLLDVSPGSSLSFDQRPSNARPPSVSSSSSSSHQNSQTAFIGRRDSPSYAGATKTQPFHSQSQFGTNV